MHFKVYLSNWVTDHFGINSVSRPKVAIMMFGVNSICRMCQVFEVSSNVNNSWLPTHLKCDGIQTQTKFTQLVASH